MNHNIRIVPEKKQSALDQLIDGIDSDPAFQLVMHPGKPSVRSRVQEQVHQWFKPTVLSEKLLEGLEKNFDTSEVVEGGELVCGSRLVWSVPTLASPLVGARCGADAALAAMVYNLHGNEKGKDFLRGIDRFLTKDAAFVMYRYGGDRPSLEANALYALAQGIVNNDVAAALLVVKAWEASIGKTQEGVWREGPGDGHVAVNVKFAGNIFTAMTYYLAGWTDAAQEIYRAVMTGSGLWAEVRPSSKEEHEHDRVIAFVSTNGGSRDIDTKGTLALALYEWCCGDNERAQAFVRGFYHYANVARMVDTKSDVIMGKNREVWSPWYSAMCALVSMAAAARAERDKV